MAQRGSAVRGLMHFYPELWRRDGLTPAARTPAWLRETCPIAVRKVAVQASRGINQKSSRAITRNRPHDVGEVILDLPLRYSQQAGKVPCGEQGPRDGLNDSLS